MDGSTAGIDSDDDRHILYFEFVDRLHPQVFECHDPCGTNGFRDQVGRTADSDQRGGAILLDRLYGTGSTLSLADRSESPARTEDRTHERVHPVCGRRPGRAYDLVSCGVHRSDVVDHPPCKWNRKRVSRTEKSGNPVVGGITGSQQLS